MRAALDIGATVDESLRFWHLFTILVCVTGIAAGQILFKLVAIGLQSTSGVLHPRVLLPFGSALVVYVIVTLLWIWVLQFVPLNLAYPFMALSFVVVPVASRLLLDEHLSIQYAIGVVLIGVGVLLTSR